MHKKNNRADPLLILRGIACLAVLIWHIGPPKRYLYINNINLSWITFPSGIMAVWIFFILSGYLIGKNFYLGKYTLSKKGLYRFFYNRLIRVAPLYFFNIIFLSVFVYPEVWKNSPQMLLRLFTFTANNFWLLWNFNAPLWAVSVEIQFYLLSPLIFLFMIYLPKKLPFYLIFIYIILLFGVLVRTHFYIKYLVFTSYNYISYLYTPLITNIDFFLFGFFLNPIIGKYRELNKRIFFNNHLSRLSTITLIISLVSLYLFSSYSSTYFFPEYSKYKDYVIFLLPPITCLVIGYYICYFELPKYGNSFHLYRRKLNFSSILANPVRFLEIFGLLSYGIYIWHRPIIEKLTLINSNYFSMPAFLEKFIPGFLITLTVSIITYIIIEKPALSLKKK